MVMHFSSPLSCSRYFFLSFSLVFLSSSSSFFLELLSSSGYKELYWELLPSLT